MIPGNEDIIKFDAEGNTGSKERFFSKVRQFLNSPFYTAIIVVLVGVVSFQLGLLVNLGSRRAPIVLTEPIRNDAGQLNKETIKASATVPQAIPAQGREGQLVGAKTGSRYYYPWCGGANRISEKNKIYFASVAEARAKGYTPAANCKGLE